MGKHWDSTGIANNVEMWGECLRVLKPGGHLLAFSGTRTYHRMASAIEDAGFEVRNQIIWAFGSGFPKSMRINSSPKFCQCALAGRNVGSTNPSQLQADHNSKVLDEHDDDLPLSSAPRLKNEDAGFRGDCRQDCDSSDEQLQDTLSHDQESAPSQGYALVHNHSSLPDDVQDSEPLHSPSSVRYNDHLSNLDYSHHKEVSSEKQDILSDHKLPSGRFYKADHKQRNLDNSYNKYSNGFPLCQICGKPNADGWGTQLKPAFEPICMAMKPLSEKGFSENCLKWGTGGINIDESRVDLVGIEEHRTEGRSGLGNNIFGKYKNRQKELTELPRYNPTGRFPANLIHDNSEEVRECFPETKSGNLNYTNKGGDFGVYSKQYERKVEHSGDSGNASRFFKSIVYTAKASKRDRDDGLEGFEEQKTTFADGTGLKNNGDGTPRNQTPSNKNHHPTVKPTELMRYLCRMVTPKGGTVLDPFMGSGSTGKGAKLEHFSFIGIELDPEYYEIAQSRIKAVHPTLL